MKKIINYSVIFLMLTVMSCKKDIELTNEPIPVPIYRIEFTQGENYKLVQKRLEFGAGIKLQGYNGKVLFLNEDLPNPSYVFETEGVASKLNLLLRIEDNGSSEVTQFGFKVFKNGKQVMNVTHSASGNATKEHRISI